LRVLSKGLQPLAADTPVDLFVQSTSGVGRLLLDPAGDRIVLPGLVTEPSRDSLELSNIVLGRIFRLPAASELSPTRPLDPAGDLVQLPRHNLTWLGLTADGSYVSTAYHGRVFLTATERARDDAELDLFEGNMKHITGAAWADPGHLLLLVDDGTLYGITETSWTTTSEHLPIAEGTHAFRLFTSSVSGETLRYVGCGSDYDQLSSVRVYDSTGVLRDVVASPTGRDEFTVGSGGDVVFWNFVEGFVSAGGRTLYVTEVGNPVAVLSLD